MDILGPGENQCQEIRVISRIIRWTTGGLEYELDQRHAERVIKELGLERSKPVSSPWVEEVTKTQCRRPEEDEELDAEEARRYRGIAARIN